MTKQLFTCILLLLITSSSFAQDYKFGKVSKEELLENNYNNDSSVDAAVIHREEKIYYNYVQDEGFKKYTEVFERIKIYKEDGYVWGTKTERLYQGAGGKNELLNSLKAYTYNLVNGDVEKAKLKKNGVFKEEVNKYWKSHKFTMPNLKPGCVIEYKYTIESPYLELDKAIFQYTVPIKNLEYKLEVPEYFRIKKIINPKATYVPEITESAKSRKLFVSYHSALANGGGSVTAKFSKENLIEKTYDIIDKVYNANLKNIPALKKEAYVKNIDNYRAIVEWEIESVKGFDDSVKEFSTNWNQVVKTIYFDENFGGQLNKENYYKKEVDDLIEGISDSKKITAKLFYYVKSKIRWNQFIGYRADVGTKEAYKKGVGNIADINLMLLSMLRYAGINANPVLISTRDNGIPLTPTAKGFNYVIARVNIDGEEMFLDASNSNAGFNILPERALNWQGRVINEQGNSEWVSLQPKEHSKTIVQMNCEMQNDLTLNGKYRNRLTNYAAYKYRNSYGKLSKESLVSTLENGKGEIIIENVDTKNIKDIEKPISVSYDFKLENAVEEVNGELYFSPLLFLNKNKKSFKQDTRVYPIDLIYPTESKYIISIKIPEGYQIKSMPENAQVKLNETDGNFTYVIEEKGESIQLVVNSKLSNTIITPSEYDVFKSFNDLSHDKLSEQIVLVKK